VEIFAFNATGFASGMIHYTYRIGNVGGTTAGGAINGPTLSSAVGHDGSNWKEITGDTQLDANSLALGTGAGDFVTLDYTSTGSNTLRLVFSVKVLLETL
jgi:hypothetical protein